jgi:hypothetical protein
MLDGVGLMGSGTGRSVRDVLDVRNQHSRLFSIAIQDHDFARTTPGHEGGQTRRPDGTCADDPDFHLPLLPVAGETSLPRCPKQRSLRVPMTDRPHIICDSGEVGLG